MAIARFFQVLGWIVVAAAVILGLLMMLNSEKQFGETAFSYFVSGFVVLVLGAIQGLFLVLIGSYVEARLSFDDEVGGIFQQLRRRS